MGTLAQVILFSSNVARLREFYRDQLGLAVIEDEPGWVRMHAGGTVLALHAIPFTVDVTHERTDAAIKLCFHSDDLEAERARLVAAGVVMREIHHYGKIAYCDGIDPEGNVFQLTTR